MELPTSHLLMGLIAHLLEGEDNTGCDDDLTVVNKSTLESLREYYENRMICPRNLIIHYPMDGISCVIGQVDMQDNPDIDLFWDEFQSQSTQPDTDEQFLDFLSERGIKVRHSVYPDLTLEYLKG